MGTKVIVITGASSGIGFGIAEALSHDENNKLVLVSRSTKKLDNAKRRLRKNQAKVYCVAADVTNQDQVQAMIDETLSLCGTIDYLIMSAGVSIHGKFQDLLVRDWDEVVGTNLKGVFLTCKAVWPIMMQKNGCQIINVSSASGLSSYPTSSIYSASKAGVNALMDALILEGQEVGIKVSNIIPGQVDTAIWNPDDEDVNAARPGMLTPRSIGEYVEFMLSRPYNEHFRSVIVHPFAIQPLLRGRNRGPGGLFPQEKDRAQLNKDQKFRI